MDDDLADNDGFGFGIEAMYGREVSDNLILSTGLLSKLYMVDVGVEGFDNTASLFTSKLSFGLPIRANFQTRLGERTIGSFYGGPLFEWLFNVMDTGGFTTSEDDYLTLGYSTRDQDELMFGIGGNAGFNIKFPSQHSNRSFLIGLDYTFTGENSFTNEYYFYSQSDSSPVPEMDGAYLEKINMLSFKLGMGINNK